MYIPDHFSQTDIAEIDRLCAAHPLASLIAFNGQELIANHIPLLRDGDQFVGHVAKANPMHEAIAPDAPVLAIFTAGDGYVSPNWYPSKAETHRAVPTWNYQVVHVHGTLAFTHEESQKRRILNQLTRHFERQTNGDAAWRMGDAPADFMQAQLDGIVAFRLNVSRIEAKSKLSQNRQPADRSNVIRQFEEQGNAELSAAMRANDHRG